jgi:hypothetical protein
MTTDATFDPAAEARRQIAIAEALEGEANEALAAFKARQDLARQTVDDFNAALREGHSALVEVARKRAHEAGRNFNNQSTGPTYRFELDRLELMLARVESDAFVADQLLQIGGIKPDDIRAAIELRDSVAALREAFDEKTRLARRYKGMK